MDKTIKEVFQELLAQVLDDKNLNQGGLYNIYNIIHILKEEEEADKICRHFGIEKSNCQHQDIWIIEDQIQSKMNLNFIPKNNLINSFFPFSSHENTQNSEQSNMKDRVLLLAGAVVICGLFYLYLKDNNAQRGTKAPRKNSPKQTYPEVQPAETPHQPAKAALCLVVTESDLSSIFNSKEVQHEFVEYNKVTVDELKKLIDHASYFLCTTVEDALKKEENLEINRGQSISFDRNSKQNVYLRIHIDNAQAMIDKKNHYALKSNLPSSGGGRERETTACLQSLNGLETFNRV